MSKSRQIFYGLAGFRSLLITQALFNFGFFGLKSLFVISLLNRQLFSENEVVELFATLMGLAYGTSLIGGWLADHILGVKKTLILGGLISGIGVSLLTYPSTLTIFVAIALLSLGSGCFKPCFLTALSRLFSNPHDQRKDRAFTRLYIAMNIGSLLGPAVSGFVQHHYGTVITLIIIALSFMIGTGLFYKRFRTIAFGQQLMNGSSLFYTIISLIVGFIGLTYCLQYPLYLHGVMFVAVIISFVAYGVIFKSSTQLERGNLLKLIPYALFFTIFCIFLEQAGSSLVIFFERYVDRIIMGITIPSSTLLSLNPILVILVGFVSPVLSERYPRWQHIHSLTKFSGGFVFISLSFAVLASSSHNTTSVALGWIGLSLVLQTLGEILIIPTGFAIVSKLAPPRHVSLLMSLWMMCIAYGHILAGRLAQLSLSTSVDREISSQYYYEFFFNLSSAAVLAVVILLILRFLQQRFSQQATSNNSS